MNIFRWFARTVIDFIDELRNWIIVGDTAVPVPAKPATESKTAPAPEVKTAPEPAVAPTPTSTPTTISQKLAEARAKKIASDNEKNEAISKENQDEQEVLSGSIADNNDAELSERIRTLREGIRFRLSDTVKLVKLNGRDDSSNLDKIHNELDDVKLLWPSDVIELPKLYKKILANINVKHAELPLADGFWQIAFPHYEGFNYIIVMPLAKIVAIAQEIEMMKGFFIHAIPRRHARVEYENITQVVRLDENNQIKAAREHSEKYLYGEYRFQIGFVRSIQETVELTLGARAKNEEGFAEEIANCFCNPRNRLLSRVNESFREYLAQVLAEANRMDLLQRITVAARDAETKELAFKYKISPLSKKRQR